MNIYGVPKLIRLGAQFIGRIPLVKTVYGAVRDLLLGGNGDDELPVQLDVSPYVTSNSGPLTGWALVAPPAGFSINASGVITVAGGTAPSTYSITVEADGREAQLATGSVAIAASDAGIYIDSAIGVVLIARFVIG